MMNHEKLQGTFIRDCPTFIHPSALWIQATVTLPRLQDDGFKPQDIIAFRCNHFGFARVLECGIRHLGTQHGFMHYLVLGIRGKASDEISDPYLERTLTRVTSGMHLNIAIKVRVDHDEYGQLAQIEVTQRDIDNGNIATQVNTVYEEFPSLFYGLSAKNYPRTILSARSEILHDTNWSAYEKLDFLFQGEVHHMEASYHYTTNYVGLPIRGSACVIAEGKIEIMPGRVKFVGRKPGCPGTEFATEMDENLPSERMVLALLAMTWQGSIPPGPYQLSLTTHPCNPSKWFNMEQLPPLSTEDLLQDVIATLPLKKEQTLAMLFIVTGQ